MKSESFSVATKHASLAAAVEQAAVSFVMTDIDGKIQYVNPAFTAMTGYTSEEAVGQNPRILKSGRHPAAFYKELWSTILSGRVWQGEVINCRKDGTVYHEEMRIAPVRGADGATIGYIAIKHDVTERRAAQETQAVLAAVVENSEDSIIACTPEGTIRSFNRGAETIFGYSAKEVIGRHMSMLVPRERAAALENLAQKLLRGEGFSQYEGFCLRKDGCKIQVSLTGVPIRDSGGDVMGFSNILRDITERKQLERQLRENEERFRGMFEYAPTGMCVTGMDGRFVQVNEALCRILGYSAEELLRICWAELTHPDDRISSIEKMERLKKEPGEYAEDELRNIHRLGNVVWVRVRVSLLRDSGGSPQYFLAHVEDVTERKRAEEALRESEQRFRNMADSCPSMMWVTGPTGQAEFVNRLYRNFSGITSEEAQAGRWRLLLHPDDAPEYLAAFDRAVRKRAPFSAEARVRRADGEWRMVGSRGEPRFSPDGEYLGHIGLQADIAARTKVEADLVQAREEAETAGRRLSAQHRILEGEREMLRAMIDTVPDFMYVKDIESRFIVANSALAQLMGAKKPEDLLGKTDFDFYPPEVATGFYEDEQRVIRSGQPMVDCEETFCIDAANGERIVLSTKVPLFDSEGHVTGIAGTGRDITMRKIMDDALRDSNRELQEATDWSGKLALEAEDANRAKSEFLANMSHEIRTPMNGVLGMNGLLLDSDLDQEQRHWAEVVDVSARSLLTVIDDILDFSKVEAGKLEIDTVDFNLRVLMDDFAEMMAERVGEKKVEFVCAVAPDVPTSLQGDPGRLRQIVLNLGSNAMKFTRHGEVVVRVSLISETDADACLRFSVRDTGIGIPANKLSSLFTSFTQVDASTTRMFGGTGLGLAISKKLVELMDGRIGVESKEGEGSEFWFTICLAKQSANRRVDVHSVSLKGARVLVVDDNATNREVLIAQLQSWGAVVAAVESGSTALTCLRYAVVTGNPFQVAMLDMMMPGMDGATLGRAILADETLKQVPLVMMTSMGQRGDAHLFKEIGFAAYLIKPLKQSDLHDCLVAVLAGEKHKDTRSLITRHSLREVRRGNARILLVEDNLTNQEVASGILSRLGWQADVVSDGKQAVERLESQPYDLVLMDVQMPVMDGYEATRRIRDPHYPMLNRKIPIIATTAHAMQGDAEKCLAAGMSDYISKPIDPKKLAAVVEKWLKRKVHGALVDAPIEPAAPADAPLPEPKVESLVFNREIFLERMMGDEELARDIAAGFLEDLPKMLNALKEGFALGDLESVWKQAHKMKGSAANVGGDALSAVALEIEQAGKAGDLTAVTRCIPDLEVQTAKLTEALGQWAN